MACPSLADRSQDGVVISSGYVGTPKDVTDWLESVLPNAPFNWVVTATGDNTNKRALVCSPPVGSPVEDMQVVFAWDKGTDGAVAMSHGSPMTGTVTANTLVCGFAPVGGIDTIANCLLAGNPTGSGIWRGYWRVMATADAAKVGKLDLWTSAEDLWLFLHSTSTSGTFYHVHAGAQIEALNPDAGVTSSDADGRIYVFGTTQDQPWVNNAWNDEGSSWGESTQAGNQAGPRLDYYHPGYGTWRAVNPVWRKWKDGFKPYDYGGNFIRFSIYMQDQLEGYVLGRLREIGYLDTKFGARVTLDDGTYLGRGTANSTSSGHGLLAFAT